MDGSGTTRRAMIAEALQRAYEPPPPESGADSGWGCVANLVMFWLDHPDRAPRPAELSEATLHEMIRDPRYWRQRDPAFMARVTDGFRRLYGG